MMRYISASLLGLALFPVPVFADTPSKAIPTPLERALLQSTTTDAALKRARDATGKTKEIARSKEIIDRLLTRTEEQTASQVDGSFTVLSGIRQAYDMRLPDERMLELLVTRNQAERFAAYQNATAAQFTDEDLKRLDDDIFWSTFDLGQGAAQQEFANEDGSGILIDIDPETRDATVNIYNPDGGDGLPFNLALPTRWVVADKPRERAPAQGDTGASGGSGENSNDAARQTQSDQQRESDASDDDIFVEDVPAIQPVMDPDFEPEILTPDHWDNHPEQLKGLWSMTGFRYREAQDWFITSGNDTTILPSSREAKDVVQELEQRLEDSTEIVEMHVWRNIETGEVVRQAQYKRLDLEKWDYSREVVDMPTETRERVERALETSDQRVQDGVSDAAQNQSGFDAVSQTGVAVQIRVLGACGGLLDETYFDGLNLAVRDAVDKWCEFNPALPEPIKRQLLGDGQHPWTSVFRVTPDPRSDSLVLRGTSWGGRVHFKPETNEIVRLSGPHFYANPTGSRRTDVTDTLLSGTAMGAEADESL